MPAPRDDRTDVEDGADRLDFPLARVGSGKRRRGPSIKQLVAVVVVVVAITVIKPWGGSSDQPGRADQAVIVAGSSAGAAVPATPAAPAPSMDPGRALA